MVAYLHGAEVTEVDDGTRSISTVNMSIIGMVLEAEDSASATAASVTVGSTTLKDDLTFTAVAVGNDGNAINITIKETTDVSQDVAISVKGDAITITLGTDDSGATNSNAYTVAAAVMADAEAAALVVCTTTADDTTTEVVDVCTEEFLTDGADEPFPLYTPTLVLGNERYAEDLGIDADAYKYISQTMEQYGAVMVVVRAESSDDADEQKSNIIKAIETLESSKSATAYKPRILIAPGFSDDDAVGAKLESTATKLRAMALVDMDMTATYIEAIQRRKKYGERVELLWSWHKIWDTDLNKYVHMPPSASVAGLRCRIDNEHGVHFSHSNHEIYNIVGTYNEITYELESRSSLANVMSENHVSCTINESGYLHWGNRSCTTDSKWKFVPVRRVIDMVNDSVLSSMQWAVDRPMSTQYLQDVVGSVNNYLRKLKKEGVIPGGKAWLDKDLNSADLMAEGICYIDFDVGVYYPAEHLIFRSRINNGYLEEVLANV